AAGHRQCEQASRSFSHRGGADALHPGSKINEMSAASKSRLGRGLGGLIAAAKPAAPGPNSNSHSNPTGNHVTVEDRSAPPAATAVPAGAPGYLEILVHQIDPSPYQARREITPEQLSELAESIRSEGLLQPIVVRKAGDRF